MYKLITVIIIMSLLVCGCDTGGQSALTNTELERIVYSQNIELAESAGNPVLMIGGEVVTCEEIIESPTVLGDLFISPVEYFKPLAQLLNLEQFKERAKEPMKEILTDTISKILLYQHAKRQFGEKIDESLDQAAESELRKLLLQFGGDQAKADEWLKNNRLDRKSYKERQKRAILIEWYVSSKLRDDRPITYREMKERYEAIKNEYFAKESMIQFRLIDIQSAKLKELDPNEGGAQLAEKVAGNLLAQIKAGEDFGELAKQYSHGHMRDFGGLWQPLKPDSLAPPYDVLAAAARSMEPNQVSELIKTPDHIFIMKLEQKQTAGYEPFENVQEYVRQAVLYDRQNELLNKLNDIVQQQADLGQTDEFVDFCLEQIHRKNNQQKVKK
ncbi:MAG: peptidyl-prolyl cis-trans isomerase [Sedimentisphaerales bacterium]|nr:peptidyl-prolyl cis-trans isomerase [Sedimentisphaerales bacterium]